MLISATATIFSVTRLSMRPHTADIPTLDSKKEAWKSGVVPATEARWIVSLPVLVSVTRRACAAASAARPKASAGGDSASASAGAARPRPPPVPGSDSLPHSCNRRYA